MLHYFDQRVTSYAYHFVHQLLRKVVMEMEPITLPDLDIRRGPRVYNNVRDQLFPFFFSSSFSFRFLAVLEYLPTADFYPFTSSYCV